MKFTPQIKDTTEYVLICKKCKSSFISYYKDATICDNCADENAKLKIKISKICINCGQQFYSLATRNKKYCSKKCSSESGRKKRGVFSKTYNNTCLECGKIFFSNVKNKYICSPECKSIRNKKKRLEEKQITDFIVFQRDNFCCVYCGKSSIEDGVKLHIEHIYPIKRGGKSDLFNIATSCSKCNNKKSANMISEDNIIRLWTEISRRNKNANISHYKALKIKLDRILRSRVDRLT